MRGTCAVWPDHVARPYPIEQAVTPRESPGVYRPGIFPRSARPRITGRPDTCARKGSRAPLRRGSRPALGLGFLPSRRLARGTFGELLTSRFTIPFLERL